MQEIIFLFSDFYFNWQCQGHQSCFVACILFPCKEALCFFVKFKLFIVEKMVEHSLKCGSLLSLLLWGLAQLCAISTQRIFIWHECNFGDRLLFVDSGDCKICCSS